MNTDGRNASETGRVHQPIWKEVYNDVGWSEKTNLEVCACADAEEQGQTDGFMLTCYPRGQPA